MKSNLTKPRDLPHSQESEKSVLGAILLNNRSIYLALEHRLQPEDFYQDCHQKIYECLLNLSQKNKPLDLITVSEELRNRDWFECVGGSGTLTDLFDNSFSVGNLPTYIEILKNKSKLRQIIQVGLEMVSDALGPVPDPDDFLDEVESKVFSISDQKTSGSSATLKDIFLTNLQNIEEMALRKTTVTGLGTGY